MKYFSIAGKYRFFILAMVMLFAAQSCTQSIDDVSVDPNHSTVVNPGNLLTYASFNAFGPEFYGIDRYINQFYIDWRFGGYHLQRNRGGFTNEYRQITIADKMIDEAHREDQPVYYPIAAFFKAYWIFNVTRLFGDVPYSEANNVGDDVMLPAYDKQEDIIYDILQQLKQANADLADQKDALIQGDIIYNGDATKWRKLINMLRLRILINCTMQGSVKGEKVSDMFAEIVNDPSDNPLMEKLDDSPIRREDGNPNNYYTYGDNNFVSGYRVTQWLVKEMQGRHDYRLTVFAQPTIFAQANSLDPMDLDNYAGTNPFPNVNSNSNYPLEDSKKVSRINGRYYQNTMGPPTMIMGYPEQEFILAEAALRGWINGDAETYFENGIKASFDYFGVADKVQTYLAADGVKLSGTNTEKLERIITEKYLNFYLQGGYEGYLELRRTGYPDFTKYVTPDISTLYNNGRLPLRYMYPLGEITDNKQNVLAAISRLSGGDNVFSKMWLLQGTDALRNPYPFPSQ